MLTSEFPFAAVLWDMDGTLIDSEPIWIAQETALMESLGVTWSHEDAVHCIGGPMTRVDAYMRSKLSVDNQKLFPPMSLTELLLLRMSEKMSQGVDYAPGALELFKSFQELGLKQGLVSASSRTLVDAALASIGEESFLVTVSDNDVVNSKPSPEGYLQAAERLNVPIQECLILEDSVTGVTAAIASEAWVIGVAHVTKLPIGSKSITVDSLTALNVEKIVEQFEVLMQGGVN